MCLLLFEQVKLKQNEQDKELEKLKAENKELRKKVNEQDKRNSLMEGANKNSAGQVQAQEIDLRHPDLPQGVAPGKLFTTVYHQMRQQGAQLQAVTEFSMGLSERVDRSEKNEQQSQSSMAKLERSVTRQEATTYTVANMFEAKVQAEKIERENDQVAKKLVNRK